MSQIYHPMLGERVNYTIQPVPEGGDGQTEAVIELMRKYTIEDSSSPEIQRDAQQALSECPECSAVEAVFYFVKKRLEFVRDEDTVQPFSGSIQPGDGVLVEALVRPRDMSVLSGRKMGDCDDFSMYTASLLLALGIPVSFVTVAASPDSDDFSHVYVAAYPNGVRVPLDTSHGQYPGWETKSSHRVKEWEIGGIHTMLSLFVILALGAWLVCR
jgi:hypothetical protein